MKIAGAKKSRLVTTFDRKTFRESPNPQDIKRKRVQKVVNYDVIRKFGQSQIYRMDRDAQKFLMKNWVKNMRDRVW